MGEWNFNRSECIRALVKLGFTANHKRRGQHDKYDIPKIYRDNLPVNVPPFIMIPRHRELKLQHKIIKELELIGGKQLVERFRQCL